MFYDNVVDVIEGLNRSFGLYGFEIPIDGLFDWLPVVQDGNESLREEVWKQFPEAYELAGEFLVKSNYKITDWKGNTRNNEDSLNEAEVDGYMGMLADEGKYLPW